MWDHEKLLEKDLKRYLKKGEILLAGNCRLKIYGKLSCSSGKRMKKENRVFFKNETEAVRLGFRPCGHCMPRQYQIWKKLFSR